MSNTTPLGDLSGATRDILVAVAANDGASGQELLAYLEEVSGEQLTNASFYTNIDRLVTRGLVAKGERDGRTNAYRLTEAGQAALKSDLEWRTSVLEAAANG